MNALIIAVASVAASMLQNWVNSQVSEKKEPPKPIISKYSDDPYLRAAEAEIEELLA